jgi:hypothetical protein
VTILNKKLRIARSKEQKEQLSMKELIKNNILLKEYKEKNIKKNCKKRETDFEIDVKLTQIKEIINFKNVIRNILKSNKLNEIEKIHKIYDIIRD